MYGRYTDEWKVSNIRRNNDSLIGTLLRREWNELFSTSKFQVFIVEANQSTYIHDRLTLDHVFLPDEHKYNEKTYVYDRLFFYRFFFARNTMKSK